MKYAAEMGSGAMTYTNIHKNWVRHSKVNGGGRVQGHTQYGDGTNLL
jgi:hypothetical protein